MQSLRFSFKEMGKDVPVSDRIKEKINHLSELQKTHKIQGCSLLYEEIPTKISLEEYEKILDFINELFNKAIDSAKDIDTIPSLDEKV